MRVIDANIILRIILNDNKEQFEQAKSIVNEGKCIVLTEIAAEVVYVLNKVYKIGRRELAEAVAAFLDAENIEPSDPEILKSALEIYGTQSLDFADCILCAYNICYGYEVCTFDMKLQKLIDRLNE